MRLAAIALLCACLPHPGGECSSDADCLGGPSGSFCAESVCQGPPLGALEALPSRALGRGETLHVRLHVQRSHGLASAQVIVAGQAVTAQLEADGALGALVPLSLAPSGIEAAVPLSVELRDDLGHATTYAASVTIDDLAPRIAFKASDVPAAAVLRGSKLSLRIAAQDLTAVSIDGATQNPDGSFSLPVDTATAPPGASVMTVSANATDAAGNRSTITAQVPLTRLKYFAQHPGALSIGSLVLAGSRILATAGSGEFWFLNRSDGTAIVRPVTSGAVFPRIATDGSRLFFARGADNMLCRLLPDGTTQACCGPYPRLVDGPMLGGSIAIVATGVDSSTWAQRLIAVPDAGAVCDTPMVTDQLTNFVKGTPAIAPDGTVYAVGVNFLIASGFDGKSWQSLHASVTQTNYSEQPSFRDDNTVLFPINGGFDTLVVPDPTANAKSAVSKVIAPGNLDVLAPTVAADGTALVAVDKTLFAIALDGSIRWSRIFGSNLTAPPVAGAGDVVYAGFASGQILALSLSSGATIWSYDGTAPVRGSLAPGCDGVLYAGTDDGIVALVIDSPGLADSPWPRAGHDVRGTGDARRPLRSPAGACLE